MDSSREEKVLLRSAIVAVANAKTVYGKTLSQAIDEVVELPFFRKDGTRFRFRKRTLYRWVARYRREGLAGLRDQPRQGKSTALSAAFVEHMVKTKKADREASIPDIIKGAVIIGIVNPGEVSRTTAWRRARNLNLPLLGTLAKVASTKRRFAYAHRMQMVLCDGKHFRAGTHSAKRVVFSFFDDATRMALGGVVGTAESCSLFLRGLHRVLLRYGNMICLYLDNGPAFIAEDAALICSRLGIHLINGTEGYPEGHGKIERFNQTFGKDLLRTFAGDPSIDPGFTSLEGRIEHYFREVYNRTYHEGIDGIPEEKWSNDSLSLSPIEDVRVFERQFVISRRRKVSEDNIVKLGSDNYEMPIGYAGTRVVIEEDLLRGEYHTLDEGRRVRLSPVDLAKNAHLKRSGRKPPADIPSVGPAMTAARLAYAKDFAPVVSATGDFPDPDKE